MTVESGKRCYELSRHQKPLSFVERILLECPLWGSNKCSLTWEIKHTETAYMIYQLKPSMLNSEEEFWHTPRALMIEEEPEKFKARMNSKRSNDRKNGLPNLAVQVKVRPTRVMIPTPTATDYIDRISTSTEKVNPLTGKSVTLNRFVKFWPTTEIQKSGVPTTDQAKNLNDAISGSLNPTWVEWLMGYPIGWTANV